MAKRLTTTQRKWPLSAHITFSAAWLGAAFCFLVLSIVAGATRDGNLLLGAYVTVDILDVILVQPLAIGAAVTGILLSVLTQWGLFRFVWTIAKLVLPVLLIVCGVIVFGVIRAPRTVISIISSAGLQALQNPSYHGCSSLRLSGSSGWSLRFCSGGGGVIAEGIPIGQAIVQQRSCWHIGLLVAKSTRTNTTNGWKRPGSRGGYNCEGRVWIADLGSRTRAESPFQFSEMGTEKEGVESSYGYQAPG